MTYSRKGRDKGRLGQFNQFMSTFLDGSEFVTPSHFIWEQQLNVYKKSTIFIQKQWTLKHIAVNILERNKEQWKELSKYIQHLDHCVQFSPHFPLLTHNPPQSLKKLEKTESHQEWSNLRNTFLILEKTRLWKSGVVLRRQLGRTPSLSLPIIRIKDY